jgi:hypothetical protein
MGDKEAGSDPGVIAHKRPSTRAEHERLRTTARTRETNVLAKLSYKDALESQSPPGQVNPPDLPVNLGLIYKYNSLDYYSRKLPKRLRRGEMLLRLQVTQ